MRISHRHRFVFLAYPRTASRTIRALLDGESDIRGVHLSETTPAFPFHHHMTARELKGAFDARGWRWEQYRHFCVVRNPFDRLVSLFKRRREQEARWDPRIRSVNNLLSLLFRILPARPAFSIFDATRNPARGTAAGLPAFTQDAGGEMLVEDVLRFEDLSAELPPYLKSLGLDIAVQALPQLNVSRNRSNYQEWYTPRSIERVRGMYRYEIDRYSYNFEA